jgi:protein-S-isoprenylcysteine O-methyltransferase Ste14
MSPGISSARIAARLAFVVILQSALLFGTAGTFVWVEAWVYTFGYLFFVIGIVAWLKKNSPELLEDRMTYLKKNARTWDKIIILGSTPAYLLLFGLPGLDAVRYQWSRMPTAIKVTGFVGLAISLLLFARVMKENRYLSRIVEIQKERGHKVITTGPYQYIRHPLYAAAIAFLFCVPLALGSWYGLLPALICAMFILVRTFLEDRTLHEELEGYREYTGRVRYRILPGVW